MAKYSPIYRKIWKDPDFLEYTPEDKIIFIHAFSNDSVTVSGIYPIAPRTIAFETAIPLETVVEKLTNGHIKNLIFDNDHNYLFVRHFYRENIITGGNPDILKKAVIKEYSTSRNTWLWQEFIKEYPEFIDLLPTLGQGLNKVASTLGQGSLGIGEDIKENKEDNKDTTILPIPIPIKNVKATLEQGLGKVAKAYEENIGELTPVIAEQLKDLCGNYATETITDAIKVACNANVRKMSYIIAVLEGKGSGKGLRVEKTDPNKFIQGKYGHTVARTKEDLAKRAKLRKERGGK